MNVYVSPNNIPFRGTDFHRHISALFVTATVPPAPISELYNMLKASWCEGQTRA